MKNIAIIILSLIALASIGLNIVSMRKKGNLLVDNTNSLTEKRVAAIEEYLKLLGAGRYKDIPSFFTSKAVVSDAIKGLTTPEVYYNGLYSYLTNPKVTVYDIYLGMQDQDVIAAHFTMKVQKTDGEIENRGQIVDLFVFEPGSTKFSKLYIQNNMTDYEFTK